MSSQEKNSYEQRYLEVIEYTNEIVELLILTKTHMETPQNAKINKITLMQKMWDQELCYKILINLRNKLKFVDEFYKYSQNINDIPHMNALVKEKTLINSLINHISHLHTNKFVYSALMSFICEHIKIRKDNKAFIENINLIAPLPSTTKVTNKKDNEKLINI
jgi:hypothetical protein